MKTTKTIDGEIIEWDGGICWIPCDHVAFMPQPAPRATDSPAYRAFLSRIFGQPQERPLSLSRGPSCMHISNIPAVSRELNRKG